jgi:hypothetical protein
MISIEAMIMVGIVAYGSVERGSTPRFSPL